MESLSARIRQLPAEIENHILRFAVGKNVVSDDTACIYETRIRIGNFTFEFYENEPPDVACSKCVYDCYEDRCSVCWKLNHSYEWI